MNTDKQAAIAAALETLFSKQRLTAMPTGIPGKSRPEQLQKLIGTTGEMTQTAVVCNIAKLRRHLHAERQRGAAGHWTYDSNRHLALIEALRVERHILRTRGLLAPVVHHLAVAATARRAITTGQWPGRWDRKFNRAELIAQHRAAIEDARAERGYLATMAWLDAKTA